MRHELGQWFTPAAVADVALALALPDDVTRARVLDPACGDGAFLARAVAAGVPAAQVAGVEISEVADAARAAVPGAQVRRADLFELEPELYDAVVGNPPYVRQERLSAARKLAVRARLAADWPELPAAALDRLVGRGDLAIACLLRALRMTRPGGRLAFVVSSALLDAGYADTLWRAVSERGRVLAIVDAPGERWFADAAVNAVIVVIERGAAVGPAAVARLAVPTAAAARARSVAQLRAIADVRDGGDPAAWSMLLRAPAVWFEVERAARGLLTPLGELAEIRRGITSGANDVFYVSRARAAELRLEPEVLVPLVRAPGARIGVDPDRTRDVAIVCPRDAGDRYPAARSYFAARAEAAARPTLRAREPWWALPARPARVFLTKAYSERFVQQLCARPAVADQRVYALQPRPGVDGELLAASLNTTYTALALESLGRASMGEGALEWTVADAQALPVVDPRRVPEAARAALRACLHVDVGPIAREWQLPHRAALDDAVAPALRDLRAAAGAGLTAATARRVARPRAPIV